MAEIKNLERVIGKLQALAAKAAGDDASVVVGYTAGYALWVHENRNPVNLGKDVPRPSGLGVFWGPKGRPGFLLDVAREMMDELRGIIFKAYARTKSMASALLVAGFRLQRESIQNVPVEYGNLRGSAFTRLERGVATGEVPGGVEAS